MVESFPSPPVSGFHLGPRFVRFYALGSHAAPKYFFGDRAGLLTAIAAEGFTALAASLRQAAQVGAGERLAALGRAYIDFGLANVALFDLMFRPAELHVGDPALQNAQQEAIGALSAAVTGGPSPEQPELSPAPASGPPRPERVIQRPSSHRRFRPNLPQTGRRVGSSPIASPLAAALDRAAPAHHSRVGASDSPECPIPANIWTLPTSAASSIGRAADS